jgi:sigma-B regulation protein RsbU (phosphoserine phosphatase)
MSSKTTSLFEQSEEFASAFALLAEMTRAFADTLEIESTLKRALAMIAEHLHAEAGSLWLIDEDGSHLECMASVGPSPITGMRLGIDTGIIGRSIRENVCQTVLDVNKDPNFSMAVDEESGFETRSLLCAPMSFSDEPLGAIELLNKLTDENRCFDESDIHPLEVLTSSAALSIANARMAASLVEHERVRRELELAAEIQRNLLPARRPQPFPVCGVNIPARTVSGDFFDILPLPNGRISFCLGDVSGKGMNAAMLMAKTASLYRCLAKTVDSPGALLHAHNEEICETATRGMFVTMMAASYDPATGSVCTANAGHEPLLCHHPDGSFSSHEADAPPLGILAGTEFPEVEIALNGGSLYVFSDGLTEATCESGEQLGPDGLKKMITEFAQQPVAERVDSIIDDVGELELRDDLTLLALTDRRPERLMPDGRDGRLLSFAIRARSDELCLMRDAVRACVEANGCSETPTADIVLVIDEACQNIIRHAYRGDPDGEIELQIDREGENLVFSLLDRAPLVDTKKVKGRDLDDVRPGGLGTHFIQELMDQADFLPRPGEAGNLLRMIKRIE